MPGVAGSIWVDGSSLYFTDSTAAVRSVTTAVASGGSYGVVGLVGQNGATPNTQYGYSADLVALRNTSDGTIAIRTNTGTLTNDTTVAGSTANGRDQAGAFSSNSWIHFYFIWDGATLATVSSTVAPATGPTLPSGYTHWAYVGTVRYNATPLLVKTRMAGSFMFYEVEQSALSAGSSASEATVSLSTLVPPNALRVVLFVRGNTVDSLSDFRIRVVTGQDFRRYNWPTGGGSLDYPSMSLLAPSIGQQILYIRPGSSGTLDLLVSGYSVPNGGE